MRGLIIGQSLSELIVQATPEEIHRFGVPVGADVNIGIPASVNTTAALLIALDIWQEGKWVYDEDGRPFGFLTTLTPSDDGTNGSRQKIDVTSHGHHDDALVVGLGHGGAECDFSGKVRGGLVPGGRL